MARRKENQHDGWIQPPSHYLELVSLSFQERIIFSFQSSCSCFSSFLLMFLLNLQLLLFKQLSSQNYSAHSLISPPNPPILLLRSVNLVFLVLYFLL